MLLLVNDCTSENVGECKPCLRKWGNNTNEETYVKMIFRVQMININFNLKYFLRSTNFRVNEHL